MKKYSLEGLTGTELESAKNFNELVDKLEQAATKEQITAVENQLKALSDKEVVSKEDFTKLEKAMQDQSRAIADLGKTAKQEEPMTTAKAIVAMFEENELKSLADLKKVEKTVIQLKADNPLIASSYTGDYFRTKPVGDMKFAPLRPTAFIGKGISTDTLEEGKNLLLWTVGEFTDHVAYIGELSDATTTVDGSKIIAQDKTRELSGLVARAIVTRRSFEDLPQLAKRVDRMLMERIPLWLDEKIWDGDGNDSTAKYEMYGIKNSCTAFDATGLPKVEKPNIGDLAGAAALQAKNLYHMVNTVWMSANLSFKLQRTKDTSGQYIINKLVDGTLMMNGLKVIETELFGGATEQMLVGDISAIQFWVKRNLEAEFERVAKTDSWNLFVYGRQQVLVEDEDIKSLIYIDNVATALSEIDVEEA